MILVDEFRDGNVGTSALQPSMQKWRPATLRYRLLNQAGRIVEHTRQLVLRLPWVDDLVELCRRCRERLWQESPVGPVLQTEG
ncbi:MAG: hypothetical protein HY303_18180 [Candidatus Wallbacteria bacterium]|nr:hypothetical protein [Candidatus Wallbacteria bacterium]